MSRHAADRFFERFGIVFGTAEEREALEAIAACRCIQRVVSDTNGRPHYLIEMQGPERLEVVEVVLSCNSQHVVTALIPSSEAVATFRAAFPSSEVTRVSEGESP